LDVEHNAEVRSERWFAFADCIAEGVWHHNLRLSSSVRSELMHYGDVELSRPLRYAGG